MDRVGASGRPALAATVGDGHAVGLALTRGPGRWRATHAVAGHPGRRDGDVDVGELAEPELVLFDHLVLDNQAAAVTGRGDCDAQGHTGSWGQVGGQVESLICVPGVVAVAASGVSEMNS